MMEVVPHDFSANIWGSPALKFRLRPKTVGSHSQGILKRENLFLWLAAMNFILKLTNKIDFWPQ